MGSSGGEKAGVFNLAGPTRNGSNYLGSSRVQSTSHDVISLQLLYTAFLLPLLPPSASNSPPLPFRVQTKAQLHPREKKPAQLPMHQAIPCSNTRAWPRPADLSSSPPLRQSGGVRQVVNDNPVVVVGRKGCCMSHVVRRLLQGLGVNPTVYEVSTDEETSVAREVFGSGDVTFPVVFIGGKLLGGLDRLMAVHITGELVPILKAAGALWL